MRLGDVLYPLRRVPGFPQDIPSGAPVTVRGFTHFTKTGKWSKRAHADGRTRVRVEYRGHEYWVDAEALSAEKVSYAANPKPWTAVFENPRKRPSRCGLRIGQKVRVKAEYREFESAVRWRGKEYDGPRGVGVIRSFGEESILPALGSIVVVHFPGEPWSKSRDGLWRLACELLEKAP